MADELTALLQSQGPSGPLPPTISRVPDRYSLFATKCYAGMLAFRSLLETNKDFPNCNNLFNDYSPVQVIQNLRKFALNFKDTFADVMPMLNSIELDGPWVNIIESIKTMGLTSNSNNIVENLYALYDQIEAMMSPLAGNAGAPQAGGARSSAIDIEDILGPRPSKTQRGGARCYQLKTGGPIYTTTGEAANLSGETITLKNTTNQEEIEVAEGELDELYKTVPCPTTTLASAQTGPTDAQLIDLYESIKADTRTNLPTLAAQVKGIEDYNPGEIITRKQLNTLLDAKILEIQSHIASKHAAAADRRAAGAGFGIIAGTQGRKVASSLTASGRGAKNRLQFVQKILDEIREKFRVVYGEPEYDTRVSASSCLGKIWLMVKTTGLLVLLLTISTYIFSATLISDVGVSRYLGPAPLPNYAPIVYKDPTGKIQIYGIETVGVFPPGTKVRGGGLSRPAGDELSVFEEIQANVTMHDLTAVEVKNKRVTLRQQAGENWDPKKTKLYSTYWGYTGPSADDKDLMNEPLSSSEIKSTGPGGNRTETETIWANAFDKAEEALSRGQFPQSAALKEAASVMSEWIDINTLPNVQYLLPDTGNFSVIDHMWDNLKYPEAELKTIVEEYNYKNPSNVAEFLGNKAYNIISPQVQLIQIILNLANPERERLIREFKGEFEKYIRAHPDEFIHADKPPTSTVPFTSDKTYNIFGQETTVSTVGETPFTDLAQCLGNSLSLSSLILPATMASSVIGLGVYTGQWQLTMFLLSVLGGTTGIINIVGCSGTIFGAWIASIKIGLSIARTVAVLIGSASLSYSAAKQLILGKGEYNAKSKAVILQAQAEESCMELVDNGINNMLKKYDELAKENPDEYAKQIGRCISELYESEGVFTEDEQLMITKVKDIYKTLKLGEALTHAKLVPCFLEQKLNEVSGYKRIGEIFEKITNKEAEKFLEIITRNYTLMLSKKSSILGAQMQALVDEKKKPDGSTNIDALVAMKNTDPVYKQYAALKNTFDKQITNFTGKNRTDFFWSFVAHALDSALTEFQKVKTQLNEVKGGSVTTAMSDAAINVLTLLRGIGEISKLFKSGEGNIDSTAQTFLQSLVTQTLATINSNAEFLKVEVPKTMKILNGSNATASITGTANIRSFFKPKQLKNAAPAAKSANASRRNTAAKAAANAANAERARVAKVASNAANAERARVAKVASNSANAEAARVAAAANAAARAEEQARVAAAANAARVAARNAAAAAARNAAAAAAALAGEAPFVRPTPSRPASAFAPITAEPGGASSAFAAPRSPSVSAVLGLPSRPASVAPSSMAAAASRVPSRLGPAAASRAPSVSPFLRAGGGVLASGRQSAVPAHEQVRLTGRTPVPGGNGGPSAEVEELFTPAAPRGGYRKRRQTRRRVGRRTIKHKGRSKGRKTRAANNRSRRNRAYQA